MPNLVQDLICNTLGKVRRVMGLGYGRLLGAMRASSQVLAQR